MRPHRIDWLKACVMAALLVLLAIFARFVFASGITNVLLGGGGISQVSPTLTAGNNVSGGNGEIGYCVTAAGSECGSAIGSMSSTSIGPYTIEAIIDVEVSGSITQEYVAVSGFSSSPGGSWLGNVKFNSVTLAGSSATYSYTSGVATWKWITSGGWGFTSGNNYPGTITYQ